MAVRYEYIDKSAIKRAIKNYPHVAGMIDAEERNIIYRQGSGVKVRSGMPDPTFGAACGILKSKRIQALVRERDAVDYMLQQIRAVDYWEDIYKALKATQWDGESVEGAALHLGMSVSTIARYLRKCYILTGTHLGLVVVYETES